MEPNKKTPSAEETLYRMNLTLMNIKDELSDIKDELKKQRLQ